MAANAPKPMPLKLRAAAELYITGDSRKAAKNLNGLVASRTIRQWKKDCPDFQNHMAQLMEDNEEESRVKYRQIIQRGLDLLVDRLDKGNVRTEAIKGEFVMEDGEYALNSRGNKIAKTAEYREPMNSKDITYATGIIIDKYRVSLGQPSRITQGADSSDDMEKKFRAIHDKFQKSVDDMANEKLAGVVAFQGSTDS
jgi:hypothetical protein